MSRRIHPRLSDFLLGGAIFSLIFILFGFHYEEGTDIVWISTITANFKPATDAILNNFGFHTFTSYGFAALYAAIPAFPWYDVCMVLFLFLATVNLLGILREFLARAPAGSVQVWAKWLVYGLVFMLWTEHIALVQSTRIAFLLGGTALLRIILISLRDSGEKTALPIAGQYGLFILALCTRAEPVFLLLAFLPVLGLFLAIGTGKLPRLALALLPAVLIPIAFSLVLNTPFNQQDEYYLGIRPYQFVLWDFDRPEAGLQLRDRSDSTIYFAARHSFLADPAAINPEFFRRIGLREMDKSPADALNYLKNWKYNLPKAGNFFREYASRYPFLCIAILIFLAATPLFLAGMERRGRLLYLGYQLWFWLMLLGLAVFMKMEDRIFVPLLTLYGIGNLLWFFLATRLEKATGFRFQKILGISGVIALLLLSMNLLRVGKEARSRDAMAEYAGLAQAEAAETMQGKYVFVNLSTYDRLFMKLFGSHRLPEGPVWLSVDNGILFIYDSWKQYMQTIAGGSGFEAILAFWLKNETEVYFFSRPFRMELLSRYARDVYGVELEVRQLPDSFNPGFDSRYKVRPIGDRFYFYSLRAINPENP